MSVAPPPGWETRPADSPNTTVWVLPGEPVAGAFVLQQLTIHDFAEEAARG